jgi:hypothetical protein
MLLVSMTSAANLSPVSITGGKLPPESTTLAVNLHFTMSPVNKQSRKPRPKEVKRAAIKLWKTIVPLDSIRKQFNMPRGAYTRFWPMRIKILVAPSLTERRALDSDYFKKLVESMPRRLLELTERESTCTKYYYCCQ